MYLPRQYPPLSTFTDPNANRGKSILTITGVFTALACTVVLGRLWVRAVMLKTVGVDDYTMMLAMLCSAAVYVCFVAEVKLGAGEHISNPQLLGNLTIISHWTYFHSWILVIGISSVKISVGSFLLRLVQGKWHKRMLISWIIFLAIFTIASVFTLVFQCLPVNAAWDFTVKMDPTTKCYNISIFRSIGLFNGSINTFTDFIFASLPIPIILPLQINMRTKVSLIAILSLGYFACAASIVEEVLLSNFFNDPDPFFDYSFQIWNDIEMNTGILATCFPALRPLFAFLLKTATNIKASGFRRSGLTSAACHKYYIQDEDMKMASLPSRSGTVTTKNGYNITVIRGGPTGQKAPSDEQSIYRKGSDTSSGPISRLEQSITENDSGSEETIWAVQGVQDIQGGQRTYIPGERDRNQTRVILRTTEVMVSQ